MKSLVILFVVLFSCTKDNFTPTTNVQIKSSVAAVHNVFSVSGKNIRLNGVNFKVIGLRCSNALISDTETSELINNLNTFKSYGVNTVSVYIMGSRFGNIKGYNTNSTLNTTYAARLGKIIEAANSRKMVVLVGCLYWGTSTANDNIGHWTQTNANVAISNTIKWLKSKNYRNVFVDPDNEGMAQIAKKWSISSMISAANAVDVSYMIAYNSKNTPPSNADILLHFSPKSSSKPWIQSEGTPSNAPGGYWGSYSKTSDSYYNYIRIGRYTSSMKSNQISTSYSDINNYQGYMMASTWLQCVSNNGIGGAPFMKPGGNANGDVNTNVKAVQSDAGILWWLNAMKTRYGAWK